MLPRADNDRIAADSHRRCKSMAILRIVGVVPVIIAVEAYAQPRVEIVNERTTPGRVASWSTDDGNVSIDGDSTAVGVECGSINPWWVDTVYSIKVESGLCSTKKESDADRARHGGASTRVPVHPLHNPELPLF